MNYDDEGEAQKLMKENKENFEILFTWFNQFSEKSK